MMNPYVIRQLECEQYLKVGVGGSCLVQKTLDLRVWNVLFTSESNMALVKQSNFQCLFTNKALADVHECVYEYT